MNVFNKSSLKAQNSLHLFIALQTIKCSLYIPERGNLNNRFAPQKKHYKLRKCKIRWIIVALKKRILFLKLWSLAAKYLALPISWEVKTLLESVGANHLYEFLANFI